MNYHQKIITGARELFFQHGIKKITMDDIARHLSISKKTIYKEFKDKNHIVIELCKLDFKQHQTSLVLIQGKADNAIDAIVRIMNYVSSFLDRVNPKYYYDMKKYHPQAWDVYKQFKINYVINSVIEILKRGQKEELYRNDLNIDIIAKLRIAEMDAAMDTELYNPQEYELKDIHNELLRHYLQGITTIEGHHLINNYFNTSNSDLVDSELKYEIKN